MRQPCARQLSMHDTAIAQSNISPNILLNKGPLTRNRK